MIAPKLLEQMRGCLVVFKHLHLHLKFDRYLECLFFFVLYVILNLKTLCILAVAFNSRLTNLVSRIYISQKFLKCCDFCKHSCIHTFALNHLTATLGKLQGCYISKLNSIWRHLVAFYRFALNSPKKSLSIFYLEY